MRKSLIFYGMVFSLPIFIWQLVFFLAPLVFLVAPSFWSVRNFRMQPDLSAANWLYMLGRSVSWHAWWRTFALASMAAVLTSILAFPCSYAFKLSPATRRFIIFAMRISFFTSYLVRIYSWPIMALSTPFCHHQDWIRLACLTPFLA